MALLFGCEKNKLLPEILDTRIYIRIIRLSCVSRYTANSKEREENGNTEKDRECNPKVSQPI